MLDRVREAMFATLMPWLDGARVLDLFAGTGSLGLEALSRGARSVRFVERDPKVVRLLRDNVAECRVEARVEVCAGDALEPALWAPVGEEREGPDIVFLDPPYPMVEAGDGRQRLLRALEQLFPFLAPEGVVCLHSFRGRLDPAQLPPSEQVVRRYGTNDLWFLQAKEEER